MNISALVTPKNDNGSLDHRFTSIIEQLMNHCGQSCTNTLLQFWRETAESEQKAAQAALHMVVASYSLDVETWQLRRLTKSLREALQELGFKPSKVSMLIGAGKFKAEQWIQIPNDSWDYVPEEQRRQDQHKFLSAYGVSALYELSRMNSVGQAQVRIAFIENGKLMSKAELSEIRHANPANPDERRGKSNRSFQGTRQPKRQQPSKIINLNAYNELESAVDESELLQLSAQAVIKQFLRSVEPDSLDKLLHEYTPHAQDQMLALLAEAASRLADYVVSKQSINV